MIFCLPSWQRRMSQCWHVIFSHGEPRSEIWKNKFKHFISSHAEWDRLEGPRLLISATLTCLTPCMHVRVCVCVNIYTKLFPVVKLLEADLLLQATMWRKWTNDVIINRESYLDSVFHAAYRHGSSVGLCVGGVLGGWGGGQSGAPAHRHTNERG